MFYFNFYNPYQIHKIVCNSLSEYINFINPKFSDSIYNPHKREFLRIEEINSEEDSNLNEYEKQLFKKETKNKINLLNEIAHNKYDPSLSKFKIFYRGISNEKYNCASSIYRKNQIKNEDKFIKTIKMYKPEFLLDKSFLHELSALQHYGCPTRLLDLTANPLVALYFACNDALESESTITDGQVQFYIANSDDILDPYCNKALVLSTLSHMSIEDKNSIRDRCINLINKDGINAKFDKQISNNPGFIKRLYQEIKKNGYFDDFIYCKDLLSSFYIQPLLNNPRINAQSGLFIIDGLCLNEMDCSNKNANKIFARITIPASTKKEILNDLDLIGINLKSLFPEIESAIKYIKNRFTV